MIVRLSIFSSVHLVVWSYGHLIVCSFGRVLGRSFVRLVIWSLGRLFVFGSLTFMRSCDRFFFFSFYSLGLLVVSSSIRFFLFLVFLGDRFPEAVYFYGISRDSKLTLTLLQSTEEEGTNARNETGKASMQRLAESITNLDPEVILLYTTEEKIQLLMTQTVC